MNIFKEKRINVMKKLRLHPEAIIWPTTYVSLKNFESFVIDYGEIFYNKPNNESLKNKIESIQYKACIAIVVADMGGGGCGA